MFRYLLIVLAVSCVYARPRIFPSQNEQQYYHQNIPNNYENLVKILLSNLQKRCANLGGDDCANGFLPDAGMDNDYLGSGNNPGKRNILYNFLRCPNMHGDDCANGAIPDAGSDDDYLNNGGGPGKRCANLGGDDCANGFLPDAGSDGGYLGGGNTPGKRNGYHNRG